MWVHVKGRGVKRKIGIEKKRDDGRDLENTDKSDWKYEENGEGEGSIVREEEEKMHGEWRGLRFDYLFNVIDFFIYIFLKKNFFFFWRFAIGWLTANQ